MVRKVRFAVLALSCVLLLSGNWSKAQSLQPVWSQRFQKEIHWYTRTSPGILLVKWGKSLSAIDGVEGKLLWTMEDLELDDVHGMLTPWPDRGRNALEVPGMGVLLLNRVMMPGNTEGRLLALKLETGDRLWDAPELDDLTAIVPEYGTSEVVVVSLKLQRKRMAGNAAASAAVFGATKGGLILPLDYPSRYEFTRLDALTGKAQWSSEFPHTFSSPIQSLLRAGDIVFLDVGHTSVGSVNLSDGKYSVREISKWSGKGDMPRPLFALDNQAFYGRDTIAAVDVGKHQVNWETDTLGRVTGVIAENNEIIALGEHQIVALDAKTGKEHWEEKTHGHTTNIVWDKASDTLVYADGKGLHALERATGTSRLKVPWTDELRWHEIRLASPATVLLFGLEHVRGYNFKTGKQLFEEGEVKAIFRPCEFADHWPVPENGQDLGTFAAQPTQDQWDAVRKVTLLSKNLLNRLDACAGPDMDAYQTEGAPGKTRLWWVDEKDNQQVGFRLIGPHRDVSRSLGMVFGVDNKDWNRIWGAAIKNWSTATKN